MVLSDAERQRMIELFEAAYGLTPWIERDDRPAMMLLDASEEDQLAVDRCTAWETAWLHARRITDERSLTMAVEIQRLFAAGHMILAEPKEASRAVIMEAPRAVIAERQS
jgi:hypothetical protein